MTKTFHSLISLSPLRRGALASFSIGTAMAALMLAAPMTPALAQAGDATASASQPSASAPAPQSWVAGEIRRVDLKQGRLTIRHADIPHLDMQAMTMVFRVAAGVLTPEQLKAMQPGDRVEFQAEMPQGQLTLTAVRRGAAGTPAAPASEHEHHH